MNVDGMLPFENMVADYVKETENHVLYRVTPLFSGDDLVARGVLMEGWSVEDKGEGICFNVFVYNIQPGITIDYSTGGSALSGDTNKGQSTGNEASGSEALPAKRNRPISSIPIPLNSICLPVQVPPTSKRRTGKPSPAAGKS